MKRRKTKLPNKFADFEMDLRSSTRLDESVDESMRDKTVINKNDDSLKEVLEQFSQLKSRLSVLEEQNAVLQSQNDVLQKQVSQPAVTAAQKSQVQQVQLPKILPPQPPMMYTATNTQMTAGNSGMPIYNKFVPTTVNQNQYHGFEYGNAGQVGGQGELKGIEAHKNTFDLPPYQQYHPTRKLYDLPEFDGRPEDWPMFIGTYRESTEAYGYTPLENTIRLQKCLKGSARTDVESLLINPKNVLQILEHLEFHYGQPELLIRHQLKKVRELPVVTDEHLEDIVPFSTKVQNLKAFLENAGAVQQLQNPTLIEELLYKLPLSQRIKWSLFAADVKPFPTLVHFCEWLQPIARVVAKVTLSTAEEPMPTKWKKDAAKLPKKVMFAKENTTADSKLRCYVCSEDHWLRSCPKYLEQPVQKKWQTVKDNKLCFSCLSKNHSARNCRKGWKCRVAGCTKSHHTTLHENVTSESRQTDGHTANTNTIKTVATTRDRKAPQILFKMIPVEIQGKNGIIQTVAFLDEGSSSTLISEALAKEIGIRGPRQQINLQWYSGEIKKTPSMAIELQVKGTRNYHRWQKLSGHTVQSLDLPRQTIDVDDLREQFREIKHLPIDNYTDVRPEILIGLDNSHILYSIKSLVNDEGFIASNTPLGWVVYGKTGRESCQNDRICSVLHINRNYDDDLHNLVNDYFTTENFGVAVPSKLPESQEITRARELLETTTQRIGGKFESGLLWKTDDVELPNSLQMAVNRLQSIEKKNSRVPGQAEMYNNAVADFIGKGYARKLSGDEASVITPRTWYLPHFGVVNPSKPGKIRVVFDAAAQVDGVSLNSKLLKGPDLNAPLLKILFQFREKPIGVCADIKEMFLQVRINEEDQHSQRFLWRRDSSQPIETYVMTAMIFGATCSPCIAQFVKNTNAEEVSVLPEVTDAIINNHYVDDFVCSFEDEMQALQMAKEVRQVHLKAGFLLRGFMSNSARVQRALNGSEEFDLSQMKNMRSNSDKVDKILGVYWDCPRDAIVFRLRLHSIDNAILNGEKCPTKRQFLSLIMSIYDPFGMIADLLIYGKMLMQEVWQTNIAWDAELSSSLFKKFKSWLNKLKSIEEFHIDRCYGIHLTRNEAKVELHIFVDASEHAFAAVAYFRVEFEKQVKLCFIAGKTKCAPKKKLSVPRLELQSAVLGCRLKQTIISCHKVVPQKVVFWTDSTTALSWIQSETRDYKPFVAHRVAEILENSKETEWRWLPSQLNAADIATRAKYPITYEFNSRWTKGPEFLFEHEDQWPVKKIHPDTHEEKLKVHVIQRVAEIIDIQRFSNYLKLLKTIATVFRVAQICRKQIMPSILTAQELEKAENVIIGMVQKEVFPEELHSLQNNKAVAKNSHIYSLTPMLNKNGLLCVYGRIDYATAVTEATRRPIILPNRHYLTDLIIQWYHTKFYHQNDDVIINEIRRKFWVPHLRAAVKRAKRSCQRCKIADAKPIVPQMGQLPIDRLTPYIRPFSYSGLDYFGPLQVTIGRRHEKRWVALFTCLTTRAVHLELAFDLSTDACILCIRNFVNRRGIPVKIRSDMGTNFVGATGELQKATDIFDMDYIRNEVSAKGIQWEFNCPANPSSGGCWERLVQMVKRILYTVLKERAPQVETLRSLLIEAENIINSRPLTHLPVSPDDKEPLTPNHFLLGTTNSTQTPGDLDKVYPRKQYRISQQLKNHFWRRWVKEYIPTLTKRPKWYDATTNLTEGQLVLICEDNMPRSQWKMGRILKPIVAKDGHVRIAEVKTSNGTLFRPVSKLAVLDVSGESSETFTGGGMLQREHSNKT